MLRGSLTAVGLASGRVPRRVPSPHRWVPSAVSRQAAGTPTCSSPDGAEHTRGRPRDHAACLLRLDAIVFVGPESFRRPYRRPRASSVGDRRAPRFVGLLGVRRLCRPAFTASMTRSRSGRSQWRSATPSSISSCLNRLYQRPIVALYASPGVIVLGTVTEASPSELTGIRLRSRVGVRPLPAGVSLFPGLELARRNGVLRPLVPLASIVLRVDWRDSTARRGPSLRSGASMTHGRRAFACRQR